MKIIPYQFVALLLFILGISCFILFNENPTLSFFLFDLILCFYLFKIFYKNNFSILFLLHPVIFIFVSFFFTSTYLESGDGAAYRDVVFQYINPNTLETSIPELLSNGFENDIVGFFKYTSIGIAPVFIIPIYFFKVFHDYNYFQLQAILHVFLSIIVIVLAKKWAIFDKKRLFEISLFIILGPSFFDLIGAGITRHIITNFSIFLLFITLFSLKESFSINKLFWHLISLIFLLISKAPLILPYLIFLLVDNFNSKKRSNIIKKTIILFYSILFILSVFYFNKIIYAYTDNISSETGTFSILTSIPIIGILFKYLYAIVSPFPWYDFIWFKSNYSGNVFIAILHIFSSILGLQLFLIIIFKWNQIKMIDIQLKRMVILFLIMSSSIIFGTSGYHTYILIFFSIISPLLFIKKYNYLYILNISLILSLNILIFFLKL